MKKISLARAIKRLGEDFARRDWKYITVPDASKRKKTWAWPGKKEENIIICVHNGPGIQEEFHRQDFFFFNFAYKGDYGAMGQESGNKIIIKENECYIGQPHAGYALFAQNNVPVIIVGVLIKKDMFFKTFLPVLSSNVKLFRFFLQPQTDEYSEEFIHMRFAEPYCVRNLLDMMILEYVSPDENTQGILQSLTLALMFMVVRQYGKQSPHAADKRLSDKIIHYMAGHSDSVSLKELSQNFFLHPVYLSSLIRRECGKSFSELLLQIRMERALSLLKGTDLSIENIGLMLGYASSSNFYKAFKKYYGTSPRRI